MRQILSLVLALLMVTRFGSASDTVNVKTLIADMPSGMNLELHLKNKQKLRGSRGEVLASGFILVDSRGGERQIACDDVASAKQLTRKSHTTRNILMGVGIGVGVLVVVAILVVKRFPGKPVPLQPGDVVIRLSR